MNHADIEAARRLIAQFEGNALGRHNSSQFRKNPLAPEPAPVPEQRRHVTLKTRPEDCEVGDYCWSMRREMPEGMMFFRYIQRVDKSEMARYVEQGYEQVSACDILTAEFERVWIVINGQRREAWHRIA